MASRIERFAFLAATGAVLALCLVAVLVGLSGCGDDNDGPGRAPAVLTVSVTPEGVAILAAHPSLSLRKGTYGGARVYRLDAPTSHSVEITDTATLSDVLCPGSYQYILDDYSTGFVLFVDVSYPEVEEAVVAGCVYKPEKKVQVCHNGHVIEVNEHAVDSHLAHGDTIGECPPPPPPLPPPPVEPCVDEGWLILDTIDGAHCWVKAVQEFVDGLVD